MDENLYVMYGNSPKKMIIDILSKIDIETEISNDQLIGIKPNLVLAKPSKYGATTSPEIVEGIIEYLKNRGFNNIVILEGSWVGDKTDKAFKVCGYEEISKKHNIPLIDLQKDSYNKLKYRDMEINVCKKALEVDYLINVPVLKGHCQTKMTCALKNLKGCIPNNEKRRFHSQGLHKPIAYLNKILKTNLVIVDGIIGDLNFEEGGNPVNMNRIIVGKDPVFVDAYVAELMGYDINEIKYIEIADKINVGKIRKGKRRIIEINKAENSHLINTQDKLKKYEKFIYENQTCSACYGNLIHALKRYENKHGLNTINDKIKIGQGFRNKVDDGLGIGNCTMEFSDYVPGCPPSAKEILKFLERRI